MGVSSVKAPVSIADVIYLKVWDSCSGIKISTAEPLIPLFCKCYHVTVDPVMAHKGQDDHGVNSPKSRINNWLGWFINGLWLLLRQSKYFIF